MFCNMCGNQLPDTAMFCNKCGARLQSAQPAQPVGGAAPAHQARGGGVSQGWVPTQNTAHQAPVYQVQPDQMQTAAKLSIEGVRIAAMVMAALTICTSFMSWMAPASLVTSLTGAASTLLDVFTGGTAPTMTFQSSYSLWTIPGLISNASVMADYLGESSISLYFSFLYIPLAMFVAGIVLVVVGIVKTVNRNGGKIVLVWGSLLFLISAVIFMIVSFTLESGGYVSGLQTGVVLCIIFSLAALVLSIVSKDSVQA